MEIQVANRVMNLTNRASDATTHTGFPTQSVSKGFEAMSELRIDPVWGTRVVLSTKRSRRPTDFPTQPVAAASQIRAPNPNCPFCEGNESQTMPEVLAYREPGSPTDGPGWQIRVFPNRYPAVIEENDGPSYGRHEVLIVAPWHVRSFAELDHETTTATLRAVCQRLRDLKANPKTRYVLPFFNVGPDAGASLQHLHGQIVSLARVPGTIGRACHALAAHRKRRGESLWNEWLDHEATEQTRIVRRGRGHLVLCPPASRTPYETWIIADHPQPFLEETPEDHLHDLARSLDQVVRGIDHALNRPSYNLVIHTAPVIRSRRGAALIAAFRWHLQIVPRSTRIAGFELGCGWFINTTAPEEAARNLRELVVHFESQST